MGESTRKNVIYVSVGADLYDAIQTYRQRRGTTLVAAVKELLYVALDADPFKSSREVIEEMRRDRGAVDTPVAIYINGPEHGRTIGSSW